MENASRASDRDPATSIFMRFIMHPTWFHLERQSTIGQLRLNGNDSHPMRFIRAVDRKLKLDRTVTPKLPYKLRCSWRLLITCYINIIKHDILMHIKL